MRHKKKQTDTLLPAEKSDIDKHVEELMGPPPNERPSAAASAAQADAPAEAVIPLTPSTPEPTTAPMIPDELLPKEITEDGAVHAPLIDPTPPPTAPAATPVPSPPPDPPAPAEPVPSPEQLPDSAPIDDSKTIEAVDDIVAKESDTVLAAEDAVLSAAFTEPTEKPSFGVRLKRFFAAWWHNRIARWCTILLLVIGLATAASLPTSRYFVLNTVGVRSQASIEILDGSTQQPLKNVQIRLGQQTAKTGGDGKVRLQQLRLGPTQLVIERRAFATTSRPVTVGWGSNPLGTIKLSPTGSQYTFMLTDFLSGKPITDAEASADTADAAADDTGKVVLTVDNAMNDNQLQITITAPGYREERSTLNPDNKAVQQIRMAPARKHPFVSKRTGKFDVYAIDADGKNEKLLLPGTGSERDDMAVSPQPGGNSVAVVSTRDNKRNKEGYLLSSLTVLNTATGDKAELGTSERVQVVDWVGDRLIYVEIAAGTSAANPKRHRMYAYDVKGEEKKELATSNYFNDVVVVNGGIFYAPSAANQAGSATTSAFYKINPDGTNRQTLLNKETWNIFRTQYDRLAISVGQDWYEYKMGDLQTGKISGAPAVLKSRLYRDSPDKRHSLWIEERDGKGVLLQYNVTGDKKDVVLKTQSGLSNPVYWLSDQHVVYRIHTQQESADYVLSLDGGEPRKIRDVTNTAGVDAWYYYR